MQRQNFFFFRNGTLDEHGRERQQSQKARYNAQNCEIENDIEDIITEIRDQSTKNNDDECEQARRCYRKRVSSHKGLSKNPRTEHRYTSKPESVVEIDHF